MQKWNKKHKDGTNNMLKSSHNIINMSVAKQTMVSSKTGINK